MSRRLPDPPAHLVDRHPVDPGVPHGGAALLALAVAALVWLAVFAIGGCP